MVKGDAILHHRVARSETAKAAASDKSIVAPARFLAREVGARAPASPGERSASRFVEREFKAMGVDAELQRFRTPVTTAWSQMTIHLIFVLGVLLFPLTWRLGYVLVFLGFIGFLMEEFGRSPLSWLQSFRKSENVLARLPARGEARKKLVIVAHIDSPRSAFYYQPKLVRFFRAFTVLDFVCMSLLFMVFTFSFGGSILNMESSTLDFFWRLALIPLIIPLLALFALAHKAFYGKPTPGANNNASGVAVLLELGRTYARRRPQNIELWLATTGSADAGGTGIRRLLGRNRSELRGAYYIVLDNVGNGLPVCFKKEGRIFSFHANRKLLAIVREVFKVHPHYGSGFKRNGLYRNETLQLLSRGKKAITLSTRDAKGPPPNWKWKKDDLDGLDPRSMRLTLDLIRSIVDKLDQEPRNRRA